MRVYVPRHDVTLPDKTKKQSSSQCLVVKSQNFAMKSNLNPSEVTGASHDQRQFCHLSIDFGR